MSNIARYFQQAELALAAYSDLNGQMSAQAYRDALQRGGDGMSLTQVQAFADNWTVIDQYNHSESVEILDELGNPTGFYREVSNGLSVTLFEGAGGKQVIAVRGTEGLSDWVTNVIDIGLLGTAKYQGQYAALAAKVEQWRDDGVLQSGFSVTGHSLGGFLATHLALDYAAEIEHTYIYNTPGVTGLVSGNLFAGIVNALSPGKPMTFPDVLPISNIVSVSDQVSSVGLSIAPPITIDIESNLNPIHNHSIVTLTDALAVYNLFATVDPSVSLEDIGGILQASSKNANTSLESAISSLGVLYGKSYPAQVISRDALYANISDLKSSISAQSNLTIEALGTTDSNGKFWAMPPYVIENHARDNIAYRYALVNLNPFAVLGADYSSFNQNGELTLYDPATGKGLTNLYLADRAEMLANLIYCNIRDTTDAGGDGSPILYTDIRVGAENLSITSGNRQTLLDQARYTFGSKESDPLLPGTSNNDHLYGMGGNDKLYGYRGDDYLEGGEGQDVLDGGAGNDNLNGGAGRDIYMFGPDHGADTIIDVREADGFKHGIINYVDNGEIRIAYGTFTQDAEDPDTWRAANGLTLINGATWTLATPGGTIDLGADFVSGDFGIKLALPEASEEGYFQKGTNSSDMLGIYSYMDSDLCGISVNFEYTGYGPNFDTISMYGFDGADHLLGLSGEDGDFLDGGEGNDWIAGRDGADFIFGGDGDDYVTSVFGAATIHAGSGNDIILGNWTDYLFAFRDGWGVNNDWIPRHEVLNDIFNGFDPEYNNEIKIDDNGLFSPVWESLKHNSFSGQSAYDGKFNGDGPLGIPWEYNFSLSEIDEPVVDWDDMHRGFYKNLEDIRNDTDKYAGLSAQAIKMTYSHESYGVNEISDDYGVYSLNPLIYDFPELCYVTGYVPHQNPLYIHGDQGDDLLVGNDGNDFICGGEDDDTIFGNAGDDTILGENGKDFIAGGLGNDIIFGGLERDLIYGEDGDDLLFGGEGGDELDGGKGTDALWGGGGNDTYIFRPGDGPLLNGSAESVIDNEGENTVLFEDGIVRNGVQVYRSGEDMIIGYGPADLLYIYEGMTGAVQTFSFSDGETLDWLQLVGKTSYESISIYTTQPEALLIGGATGDELTATGGNSIFSGGRGNDLLTGEGGNNTYLYNLGDGTDHIVDSGGQVNGQGILMPNRILFGPGITPADITLSLGSLVIKVGNEPGNAIHIENFDPDDVFGQRSIDLFEFHDGSVLTYEQLLALGFDIEGTQGNDDMSGTNVNDRLSGGAGNDNLFGGDGNDVLDGGPGNDYLDGGSGNDVYRFGRGYGEDTISHKYSDYVAGKRDVIELGPDITPSDVSVARDGDDLVLSVNGTSDRLIVKSYLLDHPDSVRYQVEEIRFAQGVVWDVGMVKEMISDEVNTPPHVSGPVVLGSMNEDGSLIITTGQLLANAHDVDVDTLSVINLSAGSGTLTDNGDGSWTYTPVADFNGAVGFTYEVTDGMASVANFADLNVLPVNDAPVVSGPISLGDMNEDGSLIITAAQLLANAHDVDVDTLSVINLSAGSGTLTDNGDGSWTYTPVADFNGAVGFTYDVSDGTVSVPTSAGLGVLPVNDAPVVSGPISLGTMNEDGSLIITVEQLLSNAHDVDGDTLSITNLSVESGTLADNWDGNWTYTPVVDFNGAVGFTYEVTDGTVSVANFADLTVLPVNDAPVVSGPISLGEMNEDGSLIITAAQLLSNAHDVDGDTLSVVNLSAGSGTLTDNGDGSWTYLPVADFNGAVGFTYEVTDGTASMANFADLNVLPINDAPVVSGPVSLGNIFADKALSITTEQLLSHASDVDGDARSVLNLTASNGTLIDNGNGSWNYHAASDYSGPVSFSYQVTDGIEEVSASAGLTVETKLNIIRGNDKNNLLWGTKADDLILGAGGNDTLLGGDGTDTLVGGPGNDLLVGGRGDNTYVFNPGDGRDTIFDSDFSFLWNWGRQESGEDTIRFGEGIGREEVALFMRYGSLEVQYGKQDRVTVLNQNHSSGRIERIELADGSYLSDADVNQVIQQMAAFAVDEGIAMNSLNDVRNNQELMTLVANSWHSA